MYQVLPDPRAARSGLVRVIDESGEDYLYPAEYLVPVRVMIRPLASRTKPRLVWEEACRRMAKLGDDRLLDAGSLPATQWDKTEWEW